MSKAIQPLEAAIPASGVPGKCAGRRPERDESGAFSRLLASGQAENTGAGDAPRESEHADRDDTTHVSQRSDRDDKPHAPPGTARDEGQNMPEDGNSLPYAASQAVAGTGGDNVEQAVDRDAACCVPEGSVSAPDPLPQVAADHEPGAASADTGDAANENETVVPVIVTVPIESVEVVPDADGSAGVAAAAIRTGGRDPDAGTARAPDHSLAQAVREAVLHMPASRTAQEDGGGALAGNGRDQTASEPPATAPVDAGAISFADALHETGASTPSARLQVPVGQPGWGRAVGEQLVWFVSQNIRSASLRLNPQHLGPLELQLHMDGDKASVAFASQHASVRDALEAALPRLRDMFTEQGLNLVNVNISQQDVGARREHATTGYSGGGSGRADYHDPTSLLTAAPVGMVTARGLVDYYA